MKEKIERKTKKNEEKKVEKKIECHDKNCPIHGQLSARGKSFQGTVKKIVGARAVIEFSRLIYYKKYERYAKARTRLHAYMPECFRDKIKKDDLVKIMECRPLSKIMHFVVIKKIEREK